MSNNELSEEFSKLGLARLSNFTWLCTARETISVYEGVLKN
ncbi:hypothetical protein [Dulcicalothrix desertica]|nr:hypothetical protein [Dulcicalothrix desertica]